MYLLFLLILLNKMGQTKSQLVDIRYTYITCTNRLYQNQQIILILNQL